MLPSTSKVDLYVTASGNESARRSVLVQLIQRFPLDGERSESFLRGERVLLRSELADEEAQRIAIALRPLGVNAVVESSRGKLAMVELDDFAHNEPAPVAAPSSGNNFLFDVSAGLVGLDGGEEDLYRPATAPARAPEPAFGGLMGLSLSDEDAPLSGEPAPPHAKPPAKPTARPAAPPPPPTARAAPPPPKKPEPAFGGLIGLSLSDEDAPLSGEPSARPTPPRRAPVRSAPPPPPPAVAAPPPIPVATRPSEPEAIALERPNAAPPAGAKGRFGPSGTHTGNTNLELDVVPRDPMLSEPPPPSRDTFEVPRCPTHGIARIGGRCTTCDAEEKQLRSRLFSGKLRSNPQMRLALGLGAGLLLGWMLTAPLARRAESRVADLREKAQRERSRPTEEAQDVARGIDAQAAEENSSAFLRLVAVWGLIAAATTGVWYRLT